MRVLIDGHMIGERETGNETYIVNLIKALRKQPGDLELIIAIANEEAARAQLGGFDERCRAVRVSASPWARLGWQLNRAARAEKADLLHVTYTGPFSTPCPMVSTVHDVAYKVGPEWFSPRDRLVLSIGISATMRRCARIITVSQHAKSEIITHLGLPPDRIDVTLEAAAPQYRKMEEAELAQTTTLERLGINHPFILAVGNLQPRKNLLRLVESYAMAIKQVETDCRLLLVGKAQWRESEIYSCIHTHGIEDRVVFTGYVSSEDLVVLFNRALAFAYPSLYEGFGLPVVEAMACGTPVLTSSVTSIPEVASDAALLIDPLNKTDIRDGLCRLFRDGKLRATLSAKGLQRAKELTWDACAEATTASYRTALASRHN
jgi:glycosyltransferase involved in cell wall biosynthesis